MRCVWALLLSSSLLTLSCGGDKKSAAEPTPAVADEAAAVESADPAVEESPVEESPVEAAPVKDPSAELDALEAALAAPDMSAMSRSRSRSGGGGGGGGGGQDYADSQDRGCHDKCDQRAGDNQDSGKTQWGANDVGKCHADCGREDGLRDAFLECIKNNPNDKEKCRSDFREGWTKDK